MNPFGAPPPMPALSPDALALISVPEGITRRHGLSRDEWLAARETDVTASVAAALFGEHPYVTPYALWARKSGLLGPEAENASMKRGRLLEPVLLALLREAHPDWVIAPSNAYYAQPTARIGATPDFLATRPGFGGFGVIQGKTVGQFAFKKGWLDSDGDLRVPTWIGIQAAVEAALTGASWAAVGAMQLGDGGLDLIVEGVPLQPRLMGKLRVLVAEFWDRVKSGEPYPPDFFRDASAIAEVYGQDSGVETDLSGNPRVAEILALRDQLAPVIKAGHSCAEARGALDAELLFMLKNARSASVGGGRVIEAKTVKRKAYAVEESSYRTIRVKEPKE